MEATTWKRSAALPDLSTMSEMTTRMAHVIYIQIRWFSIYNLTALLLNLGKTLEGRVLFIYYYYFFFFQNLLSSVWRRGRGTKATKGLLRPNQKSNCAGQSNATGWVKTPAPAVYFTHTHTHTDVTHSHTWSIIHDIVLPYIQSEKRNSSGWIHSSFYVVQLLLFFLFCFVSPFSKMFDDLVESIELNLIRFVEMARFFCFFFWNVRPLLSAVPFPTFDRKFIIWIGYCWIHSSGQRIFTRVKCTKNKLTIKWSNRIEVSKIY